MPKKLSVSKMLDAVASGNSQCDRCGAERTARSVLRDKLGRQSKPEYRFSIAGCAITAGVLLSLWILSNLLPFNSSDAVEALHVGFAVLAGAMLFGGGKAEGRGHAH